MINDLLHSPLAITIALHYWAHRERYAWREPEHAGSIAVAEIKEALVKHGLLRSLPSRPDHTSADYEPVEDGMSVYVDALCAVPWPVKKWVIP